MKTTIENKISTITEQVLTAYSYGTAPYTILVEDSSAVHFPSPHGLGLSFNPTHIFLIYKRLDFDHDDLRDYYAYSRELIRCIPEMKARKLFEIFGRIADLPSLEQWKDERIALMLGFIKGMGAHLGINMQLADKAAVAKIQGLLPQRDGLALKEVIFAR